MEIKNNLTEQLRLKFGDITFTEQLAKDNILTLWLPLGRLREVMSYLKSEISQPFPFLYDITAIDERTRKQDNAYPPTHFTLVYHLFSFDRNSFIRLKGILQDGTLRAPSIADMWLNAIWYEREVFDMFGIRFDGH